MNIHRFVGVFVLLATAHAQDSSPDTSPSSEKQSSAASSGFSTGQTAGPAQPSLPKDFLGLADLRAKVNADIANLEKQIKSLEEDDIPKAQFVQEQVSDLKQQITELEQKKPTDAKDSERLSTLKGELRIRTLEGGPKRESLTAQLVDAKVSLEQKRQLAAKIQSAIASMLSPEQEFKRTMSITFAILIACVIIGFFAVSFRDDKIRQAIFSGEAGIQFLTLFSLVIAIILFGITQILEGKELAALLGGLSGYILGRTAPKEKTP